MTSLAAILSAAADGHFPPADGGWSRVPPWRGDLEAVIALTGHAVRDDVRVLGHPAPSGAVVTLGSASRGSPS